jgi:hypothetical protein
MRLRSLILSSLLLALPIFAHASTIYTYTGPNFTYLINPLTSEPVFTTSDFVSGSFTLNSPLAANMSYSIISPSSFSFTDQLSTITSDPNATLQSRFQVSTDASGNILQFSISLDEVAGSQEIAIYADSDGPNSYYTGDAGFILPANSSPRVANDGESFTSGKFTSSTISSTPEPSSLILLGTGCLATLGAVRRRIRS